MNPVSQSVGAASTAQVNLLPPEIAQRRSQGRARIGIFAGFVVFLLLLAGAYVYSFTTRVAAEDELAQEQARRPQLVTELASYDYINDVQAQRENSYNARAWAGLTDIDWATQLAGLNAAMPDDIQWTSMQVTQATPYSAAGDDGTVFGSLDMGTVAFVGRSLEPLAPADLVDSIDALSGYQDTWIDSSQIQSSADSDVFYWEYAGATRITFNALSGRVETAQTEVPPELLEDNAGEANEEQN
ncbi:PilN domain-containing protein [Demequina globuliformis]|uniref:PilN domain-containing protein n=1 Tax=Demequina globuliformis TaxID=676202 RepID=UPI000782190B|nr:hypothetical protein [Demequina globuliformis]